MILKKLCLAVLVPLLLMTAVIPRGSEGLTLKSTECYCPGAPDLETSYEKVKHSFLLEILTLLKLSRKKNILFSRNFDKFFAINLKKIAQNL